MTKDEEIKKLKKQKMELDDALTCRLAEISDLRTIVYERKLRLSRYAEAIKRLQRANRALYNELNGDIEKTEFDD
jgi:hypothetical protein